jgi:hypothetical protein
MEGVKPCFLLAPKKHFNNFMLFCLLECPFLPVGQTEETRKNKGQKGERAEDEAIMKILKGVKRSICLLSKH